MENNYNTEEEYKLETACRQAMAHYLDTSHWVPFYFVESLGIYSKPGEHSKSVIISQIVIRKPSAVVMRSIEDLGRWQEWFKFNDESKLLKQSSDVAIWYFSTKHIGIIRGREFVLAARKVKVSHLDVFILTSVDYASSEVKYLKIKGICYFYCFIMEEKGDVCNLTVLFSDDPKGFASKTVHTALSKRFMKRLLVLKQIIESQ